jgi:hypothetical protein
MMHEIQSFAPFPQDRWQRLKVALYAQTAIRIGDDDKGTAEGHGITLSYEYDPVGQTLTLQTLAKPFYLSEAVVDQKIHEFVEKCV